MQCALTRLDVLNRLPDVEDVLTYEDTIREHIAHMRDIDERLQTIELQATLSLNGPVKRAAQRRIRIDARGKKAGGGRVNTRSAATMERLRKRKQLHRKRIIANVFDDSGTRILSALKPYVTFNTGRINARAGKFQIDPAAASVVQKGLKQKTTPRIKLTPHAIRELKEAYLAEHGQRASASSAVRRVIADNFPRINQAIRVRGAEAAMSKAELARGGNRKGTGKEKRLPGIVERRRNGRQSFFLAEDMPEALRSKVPERGFTFPQLDEFVRTETMAEIVRRVVRNRSEWKLDAWVEKLKTELPSIVEPIVVDRDGPLTIAVSPERGLSKYLNGGVRKPGVYYVSGEAGWIPGWKSWDDPTLLTTDLKTRDQAVGKLRELVRANQRILTPQGRAEMRRNGVQLVTSDNKMLNALAAWYVSNSNRDNAEAAMSPLSAVSNYIKLVRARNGVNATLKRRVERRPVGEERRGLTRLPVNMLNSVNVSAALEQLQNASSRGGDRLPESSPQSNTSLLLELLNGSG